ncbi:MAG: FKBP-type peptidyl-prolyl cis-trans isomerase [Clostridiales bacterium]|nr:FKBP-type peptidyl-prolyl cis-trans isomerase [Roseburia sp.]MDD7637285.1 FKBP-type peptidyl-prolyl cis-trans isomerase [Clostridiales bacterium]MDY4114174.1 FKBP-type peptidyl-prolyl cis-trans isomerase [Roseburia sp.]
MKKKLVALMLGVMMVISTASCGSDEGKNAVEGTEATESVATTEVAENVPCASSAFDLKGSDYVTLCDYENVSITITGDYEVEDEDVTVSFEDMFNNYGPFYTENPDKKVIEEGDIVDVDYVGKLDGVAFEGGSAEHQVIDVYNNASVTGSGYIEGFTDGLKGASVGDVIDCDVTFPENYGNADLAGKEVVFTFTVNSIQKEMTLEDVDDNFASEQFQVETVEEMYQVIRDYLEQEADYYKQRDTYLALQSYLVDNSTVEVPEDYLAARVSDYRNQYITYYCGGDESQLENYISTYEGKTVEEMEASWAESLEKGIRLELIMDAITEKMGLEVDEEEYETYAQSVATSNGYESAEAMYGIYGYGDAEYGARYFKKLYLYDEALEKVLENATVNVDPTLVESEELTESVEETEAE